MNRALLVLRSVAPRNLSESLERIGLATVVATSCDAVRRQLNDGAFEVIVSQETLPDGGWCNVLREFLDRGLNAVLVVAASGPGGWSWSIPVQRGGEYSLAPCEGALDDVIESELRTLRARTAAASAWPAEQYMTGTQQS